MKSICVSLLCLLALTVANSKAYADMLRPPVAATALATGAHDKSTSLPSMVQSRALIPGRTCKRKIVNGMLIGAGLGAVIGGAGARTRAGVLYGAAVFASLGSIYGFKSCRP